MGIDQIPVMPTKIRPGFVAASASEWTTYHSPIRQAQGLDPVERLALAATPAKPEQGPGYQTQ
jgi:hypothetical protein